MTFTLATWNINSVRLREALVSRLLTEEMPDILCLQECKSPVEKMPLEAFRALGYHWCVARGQKSYNAWRSCRSCRWWMRATMISPISAMRGMCRRRSRTA